MASQYAGWAISVDKFFAMGSGPLRAHARVERELFEKLGYEEEADARRAGARGADAARPRPWPRGWPQKARLAAVAAHLRRSRPTASLAGGVQIAARILETGLHKMETLGLRRAPGRERAWAPRRFRRWPRTTCAPSAAPTTASCTAGRRATPSAPATPSWPSWRRKVPASASRDYGTPFYEIFQRYEGDFYKIDPLLFSPAEVWLTSTETGRTFHAGHLNPEVLTASCYPS